MSLLDTEKKSDVCTLYINNLNEKIAVNKTKYVLQKLFERYGTVLGITAHKNLKMKGQAFVTYKERKSCEKALEKLQGRPVFKKPINLSFSKTPSDLECEATGDLEAISQRKEAKRARNEAEMNNKKKLLESGSLSAPAPLSKAQIKQWKLLPPHSVLLLQNVEENMLDAASLEQKFGTFTGFTKVRLIKFRRLAFVDFDLEASATECLGKIDHDQFGSLSLLSYAKK